MESPKERMDIMEVTKELSKIRKAWYDSLCINRKKKCHYVLLCQILIMVPFLIILLSRSLMAITGAEALRVRVECSVTTTSRKESKSQMKMKLN